ncbi:hypothetical protein E4634_12435 [Mangrovimicrobium sediminis]|uniref:Uncharacterized protein n=1 Tax=Mangrovimicrobium sediminis TaxID=2562682 RepID=A0A4Z0M0L7_9GAMM|nr:hypothetical protein [Haliea sp. SAOS-164]TGD73081.1 hypothetical protein E4634_12435 [Haliea sp. SAOS-164]
MKRATSVASHWPSREMAVVDTFTKLIFEQESEFSALENSIIQAFRDVDDNVLMDSLADMGEYLRALGVTEMLELVHRVCDQLASEGLLPEISMLDSRPASQVRSVH